MKSENQRIAEEIMKKIDVSKVVALNHCSTRLRFQFQEGYEINEELKNIKGVLGVVKSMDGHQIVIGNNVSNVYDEIMVRYSFEGGVVDDDSELQEEQAGNGKKSLYTPKNIGKVFLGAMSAIVSPAVPAIVGSGLISAIIAVFKLCGVGEESSTMMYLTALSNVAFYFLPFILAYTASRYFKTSPVMSIFMAGVLMHPTVSELAAAEGSANLFGIPVYKVDYASSLIPIILTIWALKYISGWIEKIVPKAAKYVFEPLLTAIIMLPIAICLTGPIGGMIGYYLAQFSVFLSEGIPGIGVFVLSVCTPFLVLTGSHLALIPVAINSLANWGYDDWFLIAFIGMNFSQLAVALAVFFKAKKKETKALASSCAITAALAGVTEPSLYGICVKYKRPLIATFIGCAANGIYCAVTHVKIYAFAAPSLSTLPAFVDANGSNNFVFAIGAVVVTIVVTFLATWIVGIDESTEN